MEETVMSPEMADAMGAAAGAGIGIIIAELIVGVLMLVAMWKVFAKAAQPGWAIIVPIYSAIVYLKVAGKPAWWFLLMLIPGVNLVIYIIASIAIAKNFGRGGGTAAGLILLPMIFYPILAFGSAEYAGAGTEEAVA